MAASVLQTDPPACAPSFAAPNEVLSAYLERLPFASEANASCEDPHLKRPSTATALHRRRSTTKCGEQNLHEVSQQLTRGTCEEMCVLSAVAVAPQVEPFHCVCRCSKIFLAVSLIFAVTHMTAVMTHCTFSTTIPVLAWLLGGRWLAANIVLDDMTSLTGVNRWDQLSPPYLLFSFQEHRTDRRHYHLSPKLSCRHSQSEVDWTVVICHEPSDIPHLSKVCGGVSFETRKTCNNVVRICPQLIESRETFTNEKTRSHPASKPRMAALRNTTHETTNQHHKKEPQHGKTHRFGWQNLLLLGWTFTTVGVSEGTRRVVTHSTANHAPTSHFCAGAVFTTTETSFS